MRIWRDFFRQVFGIAPDKREAVQLLWSPTGLSRVALVQSDKLRVVVVTSCVVTADLMNFTNTLGLTLVFGLDHGLTLFWSEGDERPFTHRCIGLWQWCSGPSSLVYIFMRHVTYMVLRGLVSATGCVIRNG